MFLAPSSGARASNELKSQTGPRTAVGFTWGCDGTKASAPLTGQSAQPDPLNALGTATLGWGGKNLDNLKAGGKLWGEKTIASFVLPRMLGFFPGLLLQTHPCPAFHAFPDLLVLQSL